MRWPHNKRLHLTTARWQDGRAVAGEARCSTGAITLNRSMHGKHADADATARHSRNACRTGTAAFHWASASELGSASNLTTQARAVCRQTHHGELHDFCKRTAFPGTVGRNVY